VIKGQRARSTRGSLWSDRPLRRGASITEVCQRTLRVCCIWCRSSRLRTDRSWSGHWLGLSSYLFLDPVECPRQVKFKLTTPTIHQRGPPRGLDRRVPIEADFRCTNPAGQGHPLAVSVNRDEHISATRPRILSFQSLSSQLRAHRTLGSRTLVAPKRTSHPSGSRPSRLAARRPLAAFAAPENPLFPTASNTRSRTCQPHSSVASPIGDPTPCGSRYGRNELIDMGGIGAGVQSAVMVLPTFAQHCRRRPH
jgi:hypothetical protein